MLGCVTESSARVWVRTAGPARVEVVVEGGAIKAPTSAAARNSAVTQTSADRDYTALLDLGGLAPSTSYTYDVLVDGQSAFKGPKPSFRTFPTAGSKTRLTVGFGGCARYNPPKEFMWDVIASRKPDAFLFLGDNVYHDLPEDRTKQRVHYYRRQIRPEFRRLTASTSTYAIYDDHDLGVDDVAGGPDRYSPDWKLPSWEVFRENWNNPAYGGGEEQPGCWFTFSMGDIDVFMLDGRYYRAFEKGENDAGGTMLGPVQKKWLLEKLAASTATFKIIGSGTLWTKYADKKGRDSWWGVRDEREQIFSLIDEQKIGGVLLLSSDRHRSDVYRIDRPNGYAMYEFESGKITNEHTHKPNKKALFSYNEGNLFGLLTFDFTLDDPEVTFSCINQDNESVYDLTLKRSQLQAGGRAGE